MWILITYVLLLVENNEDSAPECTVLGSLQNTSVSGSSSLSLTTIQSSPAIF